MKTLKITFALAAVLLLTVSGVQSDAVVTVADDEPTVKEYSPTNLLAIEKKKLKVETQG